MLYTIVLLAREWVWLAACGAEVESGRSQSGADPGRRRC